MNRQETVKFLAQIKAAYPNFQPNFTKEQILAAAEMWQNLLTDIPYDELLNCLLKYISNNEYPPVISSLLKYRTIQSNILSPEQAWELARLISKRNWQPNYSGYEMDYLGADYFVIDAFKAVGGQKILGSLLIENTEQKKKEFIYEYKRITKNARENEFLPQHLQKIENIETYQIEEPKKQITKQSIEKPTMLNEEKANICRDFKSMLKNKFNVE